MCGIVGYVGQQDVTTLLLQGLAKLEYRGYDSAGVAIWQPPHFLIVKTEGRLANLQAALAVAGVRQPSGSASLQWGIGHTRWATHGKPSAQNAHPHQAGHVVLVHNGIIENYLELRRELVALGHQPRSETDSELLAFLILDFMDAGQSLVEAVRLSFRRLQGQCSVVVLSEREPGVMVGVRQGSPLVMGRDASGVALASDAYALLHLTSQVLFLEQGEGVVVRAGGQTKIFDLATGEEAKPREWVVLDGVAATLELGGMPHYMLKEIYEQPATLIATLNGLVDGLSAEPFALHPQPGVDLLEQASEIHLIACGTSWHAALLGKYWIESLARKSVSSELASEFRYRKPVLRPNAVVVGISQSGETADTLAVLREVKRLGVATIAITNVRLSSLAQEADAVFYTSAGPEIGVASTKSFLGQLLALYLIAGSLGRKAAAAAATTMAAQAGADLDFSQKFQDLLRLPELVSQMLAPTSETLLKVQKTVQAFGSMKGFFFLGRGLSYPIALEGALKLKELAYDHAEGYAAGELKHGPIAMIDAGMGVIVLAPRDSWRDKTLSNLAEVKARGAQLIGVGDAADCDLRELCDHWIPLVPLRGGQVVSQESGQDRLGMDADLLPFLLAPVVQLISYYRAVSLGTDVDRPRNLAKSVTVE